MRRSFGSNSDECVILYAYFKEDSQSSQTVSIVLVSILAQIIQRKGTLSQAVLDLFKEFSSQGGQTLPTPPKTARVLQSELSMYQKVYIVIDALDEFCPSDYASSRSLVVHLESLAAQLLITSRFNVDFEQESLSRRITVSAARDDIFKLVEALRKDHGRLNRHLNREACLLDEMVEVVDKRSQGMYMSSLLFLMLLVPNAKDTPRFLIARFLVETIASLPTPADVRDALQTLPAGLEDTYAFMMKRIESQAPQLVRIALLVLTWVLYARRQLTARELQHVIAFEDPNHFQKPVSADRLIYEDDILSSCAGLVVFIDNGLDSPVVELIRENYVFLLLTGFLADLYDRYLCKGVSTVSLEDQVSRQRTKNYGNLPTLSHSNDLQCAS